MSEKFETFLDEIGEGIGARQRKVDGLSKVTGEAVYVDDMTLPRMLFAKIIRSPHPHAKILSIDATEALAMEGVVACITGKDMPVKYGIIPWTQDEYPLALDKARYIGDGVACIAAVDERTAEEASYRVKVLYEPLEPILSFDEAVDNPENVVNDMARRGNIGKEVKLEFGAVDEAIEGADVVVEEEYYFENTTHTPIEPHCAIGHVDKHGRLTVWSATQVPHYLHKELARVLTMPESRIRVIQPAVGGAFGGKSEPFDLEFCVAKLAMITGRPVKILYTREEVFYAHRGRHPMRMVFKTGTDSQGMIQGVRSKIDIDGGAYFSFGLVTAYYAGQLLTAPYDFPNYAFHSRRAFTNKPACGPKRGHGSVQPRFAFEVQLDEIAEKIGMDPLEIRRINTIDAHTKTVNGQRITSNGFLQCLDAVGDASEWKKKRGKMPYGRGVGVAGSMYISGTNYAIYPNPMPQSAVQIKVDRSGVVTIFCGASDIGQGSDSVLAYIVAEELGVEVPDVHVVSSDTHLCPIDLGAYSSRVTFMMGNAAIDACRKLRRLIATAVAEAWTCDTEEVCCASGSWFHAKDTAMSMPTRKAFQLAEGRFETLGATGSYNTPKLGGDYRGGTIGASPAYSFTAHVAEVAVDTDTGVVEVERIWVAHDCGRALNPTIVEGQMEGSAYMGFAEAIMEAQTYDERGLHRGPSLLDYRIPTSMDTPEMSAHIIESHDPEGPYGAKEAGEGPLHPAIPAIANAIYDAVGVRLRAIPFDPPRVLRALRDKQAREASQESDSMSA